MSLLNRLERIFGRLAIENVTLYLIIGQAFFYLMAMLGRDYTGLIGLAPAQVLHGEFWRLFTFMLWPPSMGPLWVAFYWYMFYLMGSALEQYWGAFRFNAFLFTGWFLTVAVAFFFPEAPVTNIFVFLTVLLAFAYLNPDFELLIFFILPLKIKWLALFQAGLYLVELVRAPWSIRWTIVASLGNFVLFFGADVIQRMRTGRRRMVYQAKQFAASKSEEEPRHRCRICGRTEISDPQLDFRYCSKCAGEECYCSEHIGNHVHTTAPAPKEG
ncbi:MAG TPA: hypothetical protein VHD32_13620 [Candidatus Didemnitutus sp.]|nr:hypothetical protein [Candidatus Didemnitutus sp.]